MHFFNWTMTAKLSREKSQTAGFNMLRDENKRSASGGHGQWQLRLQQSEEEIHTNRQTIVFGGHTGAAITELLYFSSPFLPVNYSNSGASMCSFQCQQYLQNSANTHLSTVKRAIWVDSIHSLSLSVPAIVNRCKIWFHFNCPHNKSEIGHCVYACRNLSCFVIATKHKSEEKDRKLCTEKIHKGIFAVKKWQPVRRSTCVHIMYDTFTCRTYTLTVHNYGAISIESADAVVITRARMMTKGYC